MTARGMPSVPWTTDKEDRLRVLVAEGKSFRAMAAELGVTKNACIGKAHRLRLPPKEPAPRAKVAKPAPLPPRRAKPAAPIAKRTPSRPARPRPRSRRRRPDGGVTFANLTSEMCRWPLFEGTEPFHMKHYCGAEPVRGSPYCKTHTTAAFAR